MKKTFQILFVMAALGVAAGLVYAVSGTNISNDPQVCFKNKCYAVEVARTPFEHARGLMYRKNLDSDKGMLFEFKHSGNHPFWMKNTLIPLDMVWLDGQDKVVFIQHDAAPCVQDPCPSIDPKAQANYVLEVNAGEMARLGARVGDQVIIKNKN